MQINIDYLKTIHLKTRHQTWKNFIRARGSLLIWTLCNNHRSHIILLCLNKIYSTHKCHHHYIHVINIWGNLTKWCCITVIFVSKGFIQNTHCMAEDCIEMKSRFKLVGDGKRCIVSLYTSKVHDSILRKFVFIFMVIKVLITSETA